MNNNNNNRPPPPPPVDKATSDAIHARIQAVHAVQAAVHRKDPVEVHGALTELQRVGRAARPRTKLQQDVHEFIGRPSQSSSSSSSSRNLGKPTTHPVTHRPSITQPPPRRAPTTDDDLANAMGSMSLKAEREANTANPAINAVKTGMHFGHWHVTYISQYFKFNQLLKLGQPISPKYFNLEKYGVRLTVFIETLSESPDLLIVEATTDSRDELMTKLKRIMQEEQLVFVGLRPDELREPGFHLKLRGAPPTFRLDPFIQRILAPEITNWNVRRLVGENGETHSQKRATTGYAHTLTYHPERKEFSIIFKPTRTVENNLYVAFMEMTIGNGRSDVHILSVGLSEVKNVTMQCDKLLLSTMGANL